MPGINSNESKNMLLRLLELPSFQIQIAIFRSKWSIPKDGFDSYEKYKEWTLRYQEYSASIHYGFDRIVKRCKGLYSRFDPTFPLILGLYILFNKFPNSYPTDAHLPKSFPSVRWSGLLGYVDITLTLPWSFTYQHVLDAIKASEGLIEGASKLTNDSLSIINAPSEPIPDKIDDLLFLDTTPGNPADIVAKNQEDMEWLIEFGQVLLREDVKRIKSHDVIAYPDKNRHVGHGIQQIGAFLSNRGLYYAAELFWIGITKETDSINTKYDLQLNRGISLGNTGVYQIAQGKTREGLFNLYRAFEDDRKILEKLNDPNSNPEINLVSTPLFTQFEDNLIEWLTGQVLGPYLSLIDTFPTVAEIKRLIRSLNADKRLYLFSCLTTAREALQQEEILTNFISRGNLLAALGDLCRWIEDALKRKDASLNKLSQAYNFINSGGIRTGSNNLNELEINLGMAESRSNILEANALTSVFIRNYSSHNFEASSHSFFSNAERYFARICFSIVTLSRQMRI